MRRHSSALRSLGVTVLAAAAISGCLHRGPKVLGPVMDAERVAEALADGTRLRDPVRIDFEWRLTEEGVRISGRGVARLEPPYRARLDLFSGDGETLVRAALVGRDLRLPPGAPEDLLPPPDLLWGVLGVFLPEASGTLLGGDHLEGGDLRLRYADSDREELQFRARDARVVELRRLRGGRLAEDVVLTSDPESPFPAEATYRNLSEFRELRLIRTSVEASGGFPPEIWNPTGGA
ncbi:MAG: hypothetical protein OEZ65_10125 [Gemmatimonadota bacterium]|nr:hypothetical protein [Gemmatimonadota bacterium]